MAEILIGVRKINVNGPLPTNSLSREAYIALYMEAFELLERQQKALTDPQVTADYLFARENNGLFKAEKGTLAIDHAVRDADYEDEILIPERGTFHIPRSLKSGLPLFAGNLSETYQRAILGVKLSETDYSVRARKIEDFSIKNALLEAHTIPAALALDNTRPRALKTLAEKTAWFYGERNLFPDPQSQADTNNRQAAMRMERVFVFPGPKPPN